MDKCKIMTYNLDRGVVINLHGGQLMKEGKEINSSEIPTGKINGIFLLGLSLYLMFLLYLTLLSPSYGRGSFHRAYEIVPFKNVITSIINNNISALKVNIMGNIAAFVPMGFLVPLSFFNLKSVKKVLLISLITTLFIELMQFILAVGVTEIDDVILNTFGALIGFMFMKIMKNICAAITSK